VTTHLVSQEKRESSVSKNEIPLQSKIRHLQLHYKSLSDALQAKDMGKQLPLIFGKLLLVSRARWDGQHTKHKGKVACPCHYINIFVWMIMRH
jgi:hypothetical protein